MSFGGLPLVGADGCRLRRCLPGRRRVKPAASMASDQEPNKRMTRMVVGREFTVDAPSAAFTGEEGGRFQSLADGGSPVRCAHA
jgi:hypothetical protein